MIPLNNIARLKSYLANGAIGVSVAALILYLVIIGGNQDALPFLTFKDADFNFHVYCPVDTPTACNSYQRYFGSAFKNANTSNLYIVYMQAQNVTRSIYDPSTNTTTNTTDLGLYYCGLARQWSGTCDNAQLICSSPGPMFYLPVDQEVTIAWVNNISSQAIAWTQEGCYSSDSSNMECLIDAKIPDFTRPQTEGCTFNQPTNYSFSSRKVRVNKTQVPISPHIHGLQTRPAFDGNPLSWFNNVGDRGVGYFSLNDSSYFYQFDEPVLFSQFQTSRQKLNMKIIKASNKQPAGSLFYHDHAMKSTKFNVAHGLAGMYILYNKTAQQYLPKGTEQRYILFSHANDGDIRYLANNVHPSNASVQVNHSSIMKNHRLHKDKVYTNTCGNDTYNRNMTYRFRILNAHYDNVYYNISFAAYYNTIQLPNGTKVIQQIDPYTTSFPLTNFLTKINFTIIGTDATLFRDPITNINTFDAGSAERIDALLKFGPENGIPLNVNNFYLICYDASVSDYVIKNKFTLNQIISQNKYPDPLKIPTINVPFYNLSTIPKSKIAVNRMRALFSRPSDERFLINGHYMFNMGQTDNPKIGTTEDWYIINNLFEPHPIHLHLVNFQITQTYDLKKIPQGCTLYELDFFRFSNYSKFKGLNNADLCNLLDSMTEDETTQLYHFLGNYSLQTDIKPTNIGPTSGLNVLELILTANDKTAYAQYSGCSLNTVYKYVCEESTSTIKGWYKRWKETALVRQYTVMVLRVRWASTNYDENVKPYPYFAASQDEMMEFPGFVYHCHILPHQDNEMMRPFMLTASDKYLEIKSKASAVSSSVNLLNLQQTFNLNSIYLPPVANQYQSNLPTTWYEKAKQVNFLLNCPL